MQILILILANILVEPAIQDILGYQNLESDMVEKAELFTSSQRKKILQERQAGFEGGAILSAKHRDSDSSSTDGLQQSSRGQRNRPSPS